MKFYEWLECLYYSNKFEEICTHESLKIQVNFVVIWTSLFLLMFSAWICAFSHVKAAAVLSWILGHKNYSENGIVSSTEREPIGIWHCTEFLTLQNGLKHSCFPFSVTSFLCCCSNSFIFCCCSFWWSNPFPFMLFGLLAVAAIVICQSIGNMDDGLLKW